jgi:hypothetical protein
LKLTISEPCSDLFAAMAKAQAKMQTASKGATNPHFKSKYADLASVWDACRSALTENGISVIQVPSCDGNVVTVTTILGHASGQKIVGELSMTAKGPDPQSVGSVLTYARRYALSAMVSVAPDDDDANGAMGEPGQHEPQRREAPSATPGTAQYKLCPECHEKKVMPSRFGGGFYCVGCKAKFSDSMEPQTAAV